MDEPIYQKLIDQLKAARKKLGLSQRDFSARVKIPQSHISKIERGAVDIQVSSLVEMARALEMEPLLVSVRHKAWFEAIERGDDFKRQIPAYQLEEEEDEI